MRACKSCGGKGTDGKGREGIVMGAVIEGAGNDGVLLHVMERDGREESIIHEDN